MIMIIFEKETVPQETVKRQIQRIRGTILDNVWLIPEICEIHLFKGYNMFYTFSKVMHFFTGANIEA